MSRRSTTKKSPIAKIIAFIVAVAIIALGSFFIYNSFLAPSGDKLMMQRLLRRLQSKLILLVNRRLQSKLILLVKKKKEYLANKFKGLLATNSETVGYVYIPGTQLDEPVVQTNR